MCLHICGGLFDVYLRWNPDAFGNVRWTVVQRMELEISMAACLTKALFFKRFSPIR